MPIIRRRYHYGKLYMNPEIISGKGACGQTVPVLSLQGDSKNVRFAGFVDIGDLQSKQGVLLTHIEAFSSADGLGGEWCEYGRTEVLLGHEVGGCVYLVLVEGKPFSLGEMGGDGGGKKTATVTDIGQASQQKFG